MLSDESSSDSETGRFKGQTKTEESKSSDRRQDSFRSGKSRFAENDRFRKDYGNRRIEFYKHSRDRQRSSRHSPIRRRTSRDRSPRRQSNERPRHRDTSKTRDRQSASRDGQKRSRSQKSPELRSRLQKSPEPRSKSQKSTDIKDRSQRTPEPKARSQRPSEPRRDIKEEIKRTLEPSRKASPNAERKLPKHEEQSPPKTKYDRQSRDKASSSPDYKGKRSEVYIPPVIAPLKRKSSPIIVEVHSDSDKSEEVQLGSYYNMIPAVVKEKPEVSSEIDSSDDERLRAKLLNLEKELQKTRKKKHKKKHKRKSSKGSKDRDVDIPVVEVSSTTDIQDKVKEESSQSQAEAIPEVSSTQKGPKKESSEEGEITSDDDSLVEYDASDLRHKLRQSKNVTPKTDICGPALPPHLRERRSSSQEIEGPALPPHLQSKPKSKHLGPSIPEDLRKVLAEREVVKYESSDEDGGIGPLPVGTEDKWSDAHQRLEERALDIKIKSIDGRSIDSQKVKNREEWMLELPEGKAKIIGLEARSFRAKAGPDMSDRSSWTDTPEEKARKAAGEVKEEDAEVVMRREARARLVATRDDEQEVAAKKHKKKHKREESLLEQHQKKLKKKKAKEEKESDGKKERRPFTRDIDLQVNRFDEAQKKSIIKKAQDLNTRFGRGEAKYL